MRPDGVALVRGEVDPREALVGEDVEVVEPEIDEHFLQLPLAVDGAQQLSARPVPVAAPAGAEQAGPISAGRSRGASMSGSGIGLASPLLALLQQRLQVLLGNLPARSSAASACQPVARRRRSSAIRSGCSCRSIHDARPTLLTRSTSPGRGPNPRRLRTCTIVASSGDAGTAEPPARERRRAAASAERGQRDKAGASRRIANETGRIGVTPRPATLDQLPRARKLSAAASAG